MPGVTGQCSPVSHTSFRKEVSPRWGVGGTQTPFGLMTTVTRRCWVSPPFPAFGQRLAFSTGVCACDEPREFAGEQRCRNLHTLALEPCLCVIGGAGTFTGLPISLQNPRTAYPGQGREPGGLAAGKRALYQPMGCSLSLDCACFCARGCGDRLAGPLLCVPGSQRGGRGRGPAGSWRAGKS